MSTVMPPNAEKFCINDPVNKRSFPMRDATDEELALHLANAQQQHARAMNVVAQALQACMDLQAACSSMAYEIDRRARSFTIVQDLSGIKR
jgi:hypothetical protein